MSTAQPERAAKPARAKRLMRARVPAAVPQEIRPPTVTLSGDFVQRVMVIPTTMSSLILGTAFIEDERRHVLLPYIEVKIGGIEQGKATADISEDDFESLFSHVLPLENAMFVAWDVVRDVRIGCARLQTMSGGSLALEEVRLEQARDFAEKLRAEAEQCVTLLEELINGAQRNRAENSADSH